MCPNEIPSGMCYFFCLGCSIYTFFSQNITNSKRELQNASISVERKKQLDGLVQEWERDNGLSYQAVTKCNIEMSKLAEKQGESPGGESSVHTPSEGCIYSSTFTERLHGTL